MQLDKMYGYDESARQRINHEPKSDNAANAFVLFGVVFLLACLGLLGYCAVTG